MYIAHINEKTGACQTVKEHSENTANYCRKFAIPQLKETLYAMGLLHDVGKYQASFQKRIKGAPVRVEHAICGAKIAGNLLGKLPLGYLLQYCIAGHHTGLPDGGYESDDSTMSTLSGRLKRETENFSTYEKELSIPKLELETERFASLLLQNCSPDPRTAIEQVIDKFAFFTRYAFSCLVDADSLDTASFKGEDPFLRPLRADFPACLKRLVDHLGAFESVTELQKARSRLQEQAFRNIRQDAEIYLMNMPTGSGKTLCSMKCALTRAITNGKKRIIYVIPYNSIIDQTVRNFSGLFGADAEILRHQSTFSFEDSSTDDDFIYGEKRAAENWNAPIIITTAVQFFGSLLSNRRGKLRKVHNMQDSVIVFDEAHLMPLKFLQPCLQAVGYITKYLNSEAIFLTATMPDFPSLMDEYVMENNVIHPLITDTTDFAYFRKCRFEYLGETDLQGLLAKSRACPSSLIVVNTRKDAREIYNASPGPKYHLSTYMTPMDRERVLDEIRGELLRLERDFPTLTDVPEERRLLIVSTSLIEAGVDLDVHTVFRELAGLDNILQAAGRCNREGKRGEAVAYIFRYAAGNREPDSDERASLTTGLLQKHEDISSPECIREYYDRFLKLSRALITKNVLRSPNDDNPLESIKFKTYAEKAKIIDTDAMSIVVAQNEESQMLVEQLRNTGCADIRRLQRYACSVYPHELDDLIRQRAVDDYGTGVYCLRNFDYYDKNLGIMFESKDYVL